MRLPPSLPAGVRIVRRWLHGLRPARPLPRAPFVGRRRDARARRPPVHRDTIRLELPPPPDAARPPRPIVLTGPTALALPAMLADGGVAGVHPRALATLLAVLEQAPQGDVLDVRAGIGVYALAAAAYGSRPVRALEPVPDLAHVARQAAATSRLPLVVEERELAGEDTIDGYVDRRGLVPAVLRVGPAAPADVLSGARRTVERHRPWVLWTTATRDDGERVRSAARDLPRYDVHTLAADPPEARTAPEDTVEVHLLTPTRPGPGFWERCERWYAALGGLRRLVALGGRPARPPALRERRSPDA